MGGSATLPSESGYAGAGSSDSRCAAYSCQEALGRHVTLASEPLGADLSQAAENDDPTKANPPAVPRAGVQGSARDAFRDPQFRRYNLSFAASALGFTSTIVITGWLAFDLTDSTFQLGAILFVLGVVQAVMAPIGGVIADRWDRQITIVSSQGLNMIGVLVMGVIVVTGNIETWHLYVHSGFFGAIAAVHLPARQAYLFDIVGGRSISGSVAINQSTVSVIRLSAPGVGGLLIDQAGPESVYFLAAGGYVLSMFIVKFVVRRRPRPPVRAKESPFEAMKQGFSYVRRDKAILWVLIALVAGTGLGLPFRELMPAYAQDIMDLGPRGFGLLLTMVGLGSLVGSVAIAATAERVHKGRLLIAATAAMGLGLIGLGAAPNLAVAIPVLVVLGVMTTGLFVLTNILAQTYVQEEFRGRVMSFLMLTFSAVPAGSLALGSIAEAAGLRWAIAGAGVALLTMMAYLGAVRSELRGMR